MFPWKLKSATSGVDSEMGEIVFFLDSESQPFDNLGACLVGKPTIERSATIMSRVTDILLTLIHRYKDYLKYQGNYPPLFIFGENPLNKKEWIQYREQIKNLLPQPLKSGSHQLFLKASVAELYEWLHSSDWTSKWFTQKDWEYEEGSKTPRPY